MSQGSTDVKSDARLSGHCWWAIRCNLAFCLGCLIPLSVPLLAQEIEQVEEPLIDQQPFDLIVVTQEKGGDRVKIAPLDFRQMPANVKPTDELEVVLLRFPDRRYEIRWRDIETILFYEQRIYDEALEKMRAGDFILAFQNLSFLMQNYPNLPNLEGLRQEFILKSAEDRFGSGQMRQTLSALEELKATAPGFQTQRVTTALSRVANRLISDYQTSGNLAAAQALLDRIEDTYGPTLPVVKTWQAKLQQMALEKKKIAEDYVRQGEYRKAWSAAVQALGIFPDLQEVRDLMQQINRTYPMIRVGVMQRSGNLNPASLVDWPARRAGVLAYQPLFRFLETGGEGGRYGFALGTYRMSDDRQQLLLSFDAAIQSSIQPFDLAQTLVHRADPDHEQYDPSWAAVFESVELKGTNQLVVNLRRPNVLPHALMQWLLPNDPEVPGAMPGAYRLAAQDDREMSFKFRGESQEQERQPFEIVEIFYEDPKDAVNDLLRGEIDVLDQLYPADAVRLESDKRLRVGRYALPSSHMLIPISDHAYLQSPKFRRALLCATDRESMLRGELLNSNNRDDGRLISGPFPLGDGESDPLAYAYNPDIEPTEYSPPLARLLVLMTQKELSSAAQRKREPAPELEKLIVGCPDFEFARVAVQAMIQQWANVGIQAEMKILPPSELTHDAPCDLIYVIATMWEPATDIERLMGANGIARTDDPFIIQGLERLRECKNWREVRVALQNLHQLIDYHLPILPLWQVTDRYAVNRKVEGLENNSVSLYQNIEDWRIKIESSVPVSRK